MRGLKIPDIESSLRYWIFLLPFLCLGNHAVAQKQYNYFYGRVIEAGTKTGIPGVNLFIEGLRTGTVTDKKGIFSFFVDKVPATLTVTCVGFETKTILLDTTSFSLTLYLARKTTQLEEVEIKAKVNETFFKDEKYAVLDYEIDSSQVYMLIFIRQRSNAALICKNLYGDTVATSGPLGFKPERLFKDCLGFLHVLSHDSGFQVFRQGKYLQLIHPVNLKKFDAVLKNCVAATPEVLFFQKVTDHGLAVEYFGVDRKTLQKSHISRVKDEEKMKMLRRNPDDYQLLGNAIQPDSRESFVTWNYVHKVLYRPVKTSMYIIGSYTCIFNTPERQMEFYDSAGNYSYKLALAIDQVKDGRWTNDILIDEVSGKVYTVFMQNGKCHVYEINKDNGSLKNRQSLVNVYPRKIKIYNDWIYYMYDVSGDPDNRMLFRQKL
jgi:hypothetical protein